MPDGGAAADEGTTGAEAPLVLGSGDYPGLFEAADVSSLGGQRLLLRSLRIRLLLAGAAATSAAFTVRVGGGSATGPAGFDLAAVITAVIFLVVLAMEQLTAAGQPGQAWYEGRALAESVKTLAWRYAVGGAPFGRELPADRARDLLLSRLTGVQRELPGVTLVPSDRDQITPRMAALRAAPAAVRRQAYLTGRIAEQRDWYRGKARYHQLWAGRLRLAVTALEVVGVLAALAKALGLLNFDLAGIVAASVAGFAAWTQARQHSTTAPAYAVASHELAVIHQLLDREHTEPEWARTVADAEDAISREHTLWRASRTSVE